MRHVPVIRNSYKTQKSGELMSSICDTLYMDSIVTEQSRNSSYAELFFRNVNISD